MIGRPFGMYWNTRPFPSPNVAEQALRHWVIARKISPDTRTPQGSRAFALLDSAIAICRQRGLSLWPYLVAVITACRQGHPARPLPQPIG